MDSLQQLQTVILLLMAVLALTAIARKLLIPYPIFLVIGGLCLGLIPSLPAIRLDPDMVFLVFLPPILWAAAYFTSWREFRANLRPITLHAVVWCWLRPRRSPSSPMPRYRGSDGRRPSH